MSDRVSSGPRQYALQNAPWCPWGHPGLGRDPLPVQPLAAGCSRMRCAGGMEAGDMEAGDMEAGDMVAGAWEAPLRVCAESAWKMA